MLLQFYYFFLQISNPSKEEILKKKNWKSNFKSDSLERLRTEAFSILMFLISKKNMKRADQTELAFRPISFALMSTLLIFTWHF